MKKKAASLAIVLAMSLVFLGMSILMLNIRSIKANPGTVTIRVEYLDGCPRSSAIVNWEDKTHGGTGTLGVTNESGYVSDSGFQPNTIYEFKAYWPNLGQQFGPTETIVTDGNGDGSKNITANYEITPPAIAILFPLNTTYETTIIPASLPLNFTIYDYSSIDKMWYNLDNQSNVTITGNITLTLSLGQHNVKVYANDTVPGIGSVGFDEVYFTVAICDITITDITFSKTNPIINETVYILVTVKNNGNVTKNFDVSVNYTLLIDPLIGTQTITLQPEEFMILNFTWVPTASGRYEIKAYTSEILGDINPGDNTRTTYIFVSSGTMTTEQTMDTEERTERGRGRWLADLL